MIGAMILVSTSRQSRRVAIAAAPPTVRAPSPNRPREAGTYQVHSASRKPAILAPAAAVLNSSSPAVTSATSVCNSLSIHWSASGRADGGGARSPS